jgi:hypothetical protein
MKEESAMQQQPGPSDMYVQFASKTVETIGLLAEANQRVLKELADFTSGAAREGVRLYSEIQQNAVKALSEASGVPWQPAAWQEGYQKAFKLFEGNIQAVSRSAERMQSSAEQAGKGVQEAFAVVAEKLKAFYTPQN